MRVTILGPANMTGDPEYVAHVHAAGCRDAARLAKRNPHAGPADTFDASSREQIVEAVWGDIMGDEDSPWTDYENDCVFYPCVAALPREELGS